jgi:signal transduction histidine kinase
MSKKFRCLFPLLAFLICAASVTGQSQAGNDSLLITLKEIRSANDSNLARRAMFWIQHSNDDALVAKEVWNEILRTREITGTSYFTDLGIAYIRRLVDENTSAGNERGIEISKSFPPLISAAKNESEHTNNLHMFRELRICYRNQGRLNDMLQLYSESEKMFALAKDSSAISVANNVMSGAYYRMGLVERAIYHQGKSAAYLNENDKQVGSSPSSFMQGVPGKLNRHAVLASYYLRYGKTRQADSCLNIALHYYQKLDSPLVYPDIPYIFLQQAISRSMAGDPNSQSAFDTCGAFLARYKSVPSDYAVFYQERATDLIRLGQLDSASALLKKVHLNIDSFKLGVIHPWGDLTPEFEEARIAMLRGNNDEAIRLLQILIKKIEAVNLRSRVLEAYGALAKAYEAKGNMAEAYNWMSKAFVLNKEMIRDEKEARTMSFDIERKIQENETAIQLLNARDEGNKTTRLYLIGIIALLGLLALALAFFYRNKKKTGEALSSKNLKLEETLGELKSTQAQLIQAEKMASLGELTAGIAHEIQNPLNFVNNFSEVNSELITELEEAANTGNLDEVKAIALDLKANEDKIKHHGNRADSIVKGMLQHSQKASGVKELTDINAMADEYLRLAFHGLRAKDSTMNASMETELDPTIGNIMLVQQDISRVLLNLYNNAFYAVAERFKKEGSSYKPSVTLSTSKLDDKVCISIRDNGLGISENIKQKIFQPFFTTKPTGEGTGLGLSLSYDIIKAHGGEIIVDTKQGEYTEFRVTLPAN